MLFTSAPFLIYFLPLTVAGYALVSRFGRRPVLAFLVLASLVFYAYWNPRFLIVLLGSLLVNFALSKLIAQRSSSRAKQAWVFLGVSLNLAALCYYKYLFPLFRFVSTNSHLQVSVHEVLLPLGISFFTFTQIAYLVDLAQGDAEPQNLVEYSLFVTFFPHLIAGPILHHEEIMPQFAETRSFRLQSDDVFLGLSWFTLGLAKKTLVADRVGPIADSLFHHATALSASQAWLAALTYSLQLYFDFSGYSDMALGLARIFSIRFPFNFNSPYKAASIIDFWARWHITLTRYLTAYLYNPISLALRRRRLASGKDATRRAQRTPSGFAAMIAWPTLATMFLAGVWHGAGLQFIVFGVLHGIYITVNHAWRNRSGERLHTRPPAWRYVGSVLLTYGCVLIGQVFFRAESCSQAVTILSAMVGLRHMVSDSTSVVGWAMVLVLFPAVWFLPNTQEILHQAPGESTLGRVWAPLSYAQTWGWTISISLLFLVASLFISDAATFLYFQF